jgi:hypothetical protein
MSERKRDEYEFTPERRKKVKEAILSVCMKQGIDLENLFIKITEILELEPIILRSYPGANGAVSVSNYIDNLIEKIPLKSQQIMFEDLVSELTNVLAEFNLVLTPLSVTIKIAFILTDDEGSGFRNK